jgi:LacI family transcriptional regulator
MSATIKDIARKTGLGVGTISKYLNGGTVKDKNRIAIEQAIEELHYTVNEIARGLKTKHTKTVGVIVPEYANIFYMSIVSSIEDCLRKKDYSIIVCECKNNVFLEEKAVAVLMKKKVDGIINIPVSNTGEHLKLVREQNIPFVLIDREIANIKCNAVLIDNVKVSSDVTELLIKNGHRDIAIICGSNDVYTAQERLRGYRKALIKNGIIPDEKLIGCGDETIEGGYETAKKIIARNKKMTALFVTNYKSTLGVIIALNERQFNIPDDLSLVGFDNLDLANVVRPKLTIVSQPIEEIGKCASKLLLDDITSKESVLPKMIKLQATIIRGASIKRLNNNSKM